MDAALFWKQLAEARAAGRPTVWRRPLSDLGFSSDGVFRALVAAQDRLKLRVYAGSGQDAITPWYRPTVEDGSMAGWLARLDERLGSAGIVVNDYQAASPEAWRATQTILERLFREIGVPAGGASFEIFSGSYRRGKFGLHKDDQDVITVVLEGKKRFRLWPYEHFADRVPAGCELRQYAFGGLDPEPFADEALVLEGEPGDIFFWPAEYWHLAEGDGDLCTTVGIGLFRGVTTNHLIERAALLVDGDDEVPRPGVRGNAQAAMAAARRMLDAALSRGELQARVEERVIAFSSAQGCRAQPPPLPDEAIDLEQPLFAPVRSNLAWATSGDELVWAVSGTQFRYPAATALVSLLERAAGGERFVPAQLIDELSDEEVDADALAHVLTLLVRHHALIEAEAA